MRTKSTKRITLTAATLLAVSSMVATGPAFANDDDDGGFLCTYFGDLWPYAYLCDGGDGGTPPPGE